MLYALSVARLVGSSCGSRAKRTRRVVEQLYGGRVGPGDVDDVGEPCRILVLRRAQERRSLLSVEVGEARRVWFVPAHSVVRERSVAPTAPIRRRNARSEQGLVPVGFIRRS